MFAGCPLLAPGGLGSRLARCAGAFQCDGHEQYRHRGQDAVRASGAGHSLWATHLGGFAVSRFGCDSAIGYGACLRQPTARASERLGTGGSQGSDFAYRTTDHWALCHALLAAFGRAAQERRAVHVEPIAHHAGLGVDNRVGGFEHGLGGVYCRYFDCRNPF